MLVEEIIPEDHVLIRLQFKKNILEGKYRDQPVTKNFFFPDFDPYPRSLTREEIFQQLLIQCEFHFLLNLKQQKISLKNRNEILEKCQRLLVQKGYFPDDVRQYTNAFNQSGLDQVFRLVEPLLYFQGQPAVEGKIRSVWLPEDFYAISHPSENHVRLYLEKADSAGNELSKTVLVNLLTGLPEDYTESEKKTEGRNPLLSPARDAVKNIRLMYYGPARPEKIKLTGHITNPTSNRISITHLGNQFKWELVSKEILLDKDNNFEVQIDYPRKGILLIKNENNDQQAIAFQFRVYAEPGDSLHAEADVRSETQ